MTTTKDLGKLFKEARTKLDLSAEDVTRKTHINVSVINDIENGVFDRLHSLYMKSFLKKYAGFLGLNSSEILKHYDTHFPSSPAEELNTEKPVVKSVQKPVNARAVPARPKQKPRITVSSDTIIRIRAYAVYAAAIIFVFIVVRSAVIKAGDLFKGRAARTPASASKSEAKQLQKQAPKPDRIKPEKAAAPEIAPGTYSLTLTAAAEVWIQIKQGEKTLFAGVLKKGDKKTWNVSEPLNVWSGKCEKLEFSINSNDLGVIAQGVVKNIEVSDKGIKIGPSWVTRLE